MESVTQLAIHLDMEMLHDRGVEIYHEHVADSDLPECDPQADLGRRHLIKYVRSHEHEKYAIMSGVNKFAGPQWVTPTPLAPCDLMDCLALPPGEPPGWYLLLRTDMLASVRGPRRIRRGNGVEYLLPDGFTSDAIVEPKWPKRHV
jgi:hypothetical protein